MGMMIIKTKKMSPREVKKKLHEFIDNISEDCGPEIDQMADELKQHGDAFVDALSGYGGEGVNYRGNGGNGAMYRANDGQGFRNGGGYSHSFKGDNRNGGEFRDDVSMRGGNYSMREENDWNEKEKQRQRENQQKLDELEAEMRRLKMRMNSY